MTYRGSLARVSVSVLIVTLTAMGSFIGALNLFAPPAAVQTCDQTGPAINGNWVITTPQVCTGIVYTVDGSITIAAGGSLTLTNGGLKFAQDTTHIYALTVTAGRPFILDNSIITTEPRSLNAYVKLNMDVAGIFTMRNNAILKFPGTFDSSAGATITIDHSTITGFTSAEVTPWVGSLAADDNDDAPTLTFASSTVNVFDSRIERLFEDAAGASPSPRAIMTIAGTTTVIAINSYIGVDFNPDVNRIHNEVRASDSSRVVLVGVTVDQAQSDLASPDTWIPAFVPTVGSTANFHFYRWLNVFVTDNLGVPASGAGIWSQFGGFQQTVFYPDNGNALCPGATILGYIGKSCGNFNLTGADGRALLPLFTDQINTTTAPNAASFGNFEETASVAPFTVSASVAYEPYPILTGSSNARNLTLAIAGLSLPGTIQWSTTMPISGTVISVASSIEINGTVTITNGGVYMSMQSDACNRAVIKITGTGRLTLINSTIGSNCPMTLYVGNSGRLTASAGSSLNLDATGTGILRSDGSSVVTVTDSTIDSDVLAMGASVSFKRDSFTGSSIIINTAGRSDLWDANLGSTNRIQFLSDDGNVNTPDFDIRNTTFNDILTPQLTFGGSQWAQLTSVITNPASGADFWTGMISGNAKVSRYWWLTVNGVDGTGTVLEAANARITVSRLNPVTFAWANAPVPGVDDIYMATPSAWPVNAPLGFIIYRASAEERFVSTSGQWMNATYRGEASATVGAPPITYYPDANVSSFVQGDMTIELVFSSLTPEMSIGAISVYLETNATSTFQPLNRPLNLTAVVLNSGKIAVRNVVVSFFNTNVDGNNDGIMDTTKGVYMSSGLWIGDFTVPLLPLGQTRVAYVTWIPSGVAETTVLVSVVVDAPISDPLDPGAFRELNERNNTNTAAITLHVWPDLTIGRADINVPSPIDGNPTTVDVTVRNEGTNDATLASIVIADDTGWRSAPTSFNLGRGQTTTIQITWVPTSAGAHTIWAAALTPTSPFPPDRNHDFNWANNADSKPVTVATKPDVALNAADFPGTYPGVRGVPFTIPVTVHNNGDTAAVGFSISVFLDGDTSAILGHTDDVSVAGRSFTNTTVTVLVPTAVGLHQLTVFADSYDTDGTPTTRFGSIAESNEANNWANQSANLQPPLGNIVLNPITSPLNGFAPGDTILVEGFVTDQAGGDALPGIPVLVEFLDQNGNPATNGTAVSEADGSWRTGLRIPLNAVDGTRTIRASSPAGSSIQGATLTINVRNPTTFWNAIFLGLPVWLWLIIVVAAVVAIVAVTLYFRVYGLGKMVECGECGSFIPEDSTTCPKCGVEFEKDMAKCSNCQAWIPVEVKQCPECGVEFATGKVEMADYQEKMRMQYDEVVAKFREESQRVLGRALTEREFQEWWRKQATFVTFEDWLREEEEMRKMGSKPCPACGTLNSVTATVCHKCGTYLKEEKGPPSGGAPQRTEPSGGESAGAGPSEAVPKKVIRKPVAAPIVQKKVIKKPLGEQQGGGGESDTQNPPDEEF